MSQKIMTYEQLEKKYPSEEVLVVNKEKYDYIENGFHKMQEKDIFKNFEEDSFYVFRKDAEYNPKYIQLIPYVVIKNKNKYLGAIRIGGDIRLNGRFVIGMGGHINPRDKAKEIKHTFTNNIIRELSGEELYIDMCKTISLEFKGLIRCTDPNDLISQDHLGLLYVLETEDTNIRIKETETLDKGYLYSKEDILSNLENSENWSKIVIKNINSI